MRPRSLSKSVLKNEAKNHQKMHHFSTLFGAIWAPKIVKIEPRASKRPPEEQQAHKKRPRGTKSIKKMQKNYKKRPKRHLILTFLPFSAAKDQTKNNKKNSKNTPKKNRESSPCLIGSGQRVLCYMLLCYYVITRAQQPAPKKPGAGGRGRSP